MERYEDLELEQRIGELVPIYETFPQQALATELVKTQQRQKEQIARQMAMAKVIVERALEP